MVVETSPQPLGRLTDLDAPVRFRFDERISERVSSGDLSTAVTISPRVGELRVSKGARSLEVRPEGGFAPGLVYRVTLQAVVSDLFGNRMTDPFELVFTTGTDDPVATVLAGEAWDRITGQAAAGVRILAVADDGVVHQALADDRGIFALRYLPSGSFRITAFEDRDRDGEADSTEVQGQTTVDVAAGDTVLVDVSILEPDTSAARVTAAAVLDSVTATVTFDDFLPPGVDASSFQVSLARSDSAPPGDAPAVERVLQEAAYAAYVEAVSDSLERLDSIAAVETEEALTPADTGQAAPRDTVRLEQGPGPDAPERTRRAPPELPSLEGVRAGPTRDGRRILPGRRIVLLLSEALEYGIPYRVEVSGVPNIGGLAGGGGTAELVRERPPPPDSAAVDTTLTDTLAVPDTGLAPDTGSAGGLGAAPAGGIGPGTPR